MKFSIERDELLQALNAVQGVVEKRNTMPILSNLLLEAADQQKLRITATDLEVGLTALYRASVKTTGKITLNAKHLLEITRQLPSREINFQMLSNNDVEISCGKIVFKLHGLSAEEFPNLPEVGGKNLFSFPAQELGAMIDHTVFSVSNDETRYNLSGVYLEPAENGGLRMVSSDGHRLSLIERPSPSGKIKLDENIIVPRKGILEIRKICAEVEGDVEISIAKSNCQVVAGDRKLVVRLIDGEFPDYRQVLPSMEQQKKVLINREAFLAGLRRISILSQEKTHGVRFQFEKNLLKINVNNPDLGEAEEELEVQYNYPPLEVGFNAKYFLDVLNLLKCEQIDLFLNDSMSQGLIRAADDESFKAVIMPMKLL